MKKISDCNSIANFFLEIAKQEYRLKFPFGWDEFWKFTPKVENFSEKRSEQTNSKN